MSRRALSAIVAALIVAALAPAARAQDEGSLGLLLRLHYGVLGGIMVPVGPQGRDLSRGPYGSVSVVGESSLGMQLGAEVAYAASNDYLRTHFTSLGVIARLSPVPDDYRVYVQLGAALYRVSYSPKLASIASPGSTTRPGGSFGIGLDAIQAGRMAIGGLVTYQGVVIGRSTARSYLSLALNVTYRPSDY